MQAEIKRLQAQFQMLQKQASIITAGPYGVGDKKAYSDASAGLRALRKDYKEFLVAQGQFGVDSVKIKSSTEEMTKALQRNKLGVMDLIKQRKILAEVYKEQIALQNMTAVGWSKNGRGQISADVIIPNNLPAQLNNVSNRIAYMNKLLNLSSTHMINWGKNTQWAGRQLTVGLSVPLTMLAAAAGKAANEVDQQLTRITKVYDTAYTGNLSTVDAMISRERELSNLRKTSMDLATVAAKRYGVAAKDTLQVEAELAATGLKGEGLRRSTAEVVRIATLGELDYQKAVELSISLQNAYGLSTDQVTQKFNFLNSIENATSLSLQDVTEAIPRAGAALGGLGVTVEETGILLVAMKEHGVDAAEGANALKSATTRLLNPTKAAREQFSKFGIDIAQVSAEAKGNLFVILSQLADKLKNIDPYSKQQAIAALFGTYQFNRLNAALSGITEAMAGVGDGASQTAKAMEVAGQSTAQWADTARGELDQLAESASGKLKRSLETLKTELAKAGGPVLELASKGLDLLTKLVDRFNSLGPGSQKVLILLAAFGAAAGPLIMLVGLMANMVGNTLKFITTLVGLRKAFNLTNAEERAAALLANQASRGWDAQATSAFVLSKRIEKLTEDIMRMNGALAQQTLSTNRSMLPPEVIQRTNKNGQPYYMYSPASRGMPGVPKNLRANQQAFDDWTQKKAAYDAFEQSLTNAGTASTTIAANSATTTKNWSKTATYMGAAGVAATGVTAMVAPSNKLLDTFITISLVASSIAPLMGGGLKGVTTKFSQMKTALSSGLLNVKNANGFKASLGASFTTIRNIVGVFGRFAGPAGLLVTAGLLVYKMRKDLQASKEAQEQINNSTEQWANILGYTYQKVSMDAQLRKASLDDAKKMVDVNKALAAEIGKARDNQTLMNIAMREGIKVRTSGGSAEDAEKAMDTIFRIAGKSNVESRELMLNIKGKINFTNLDQMAKDAVAVFKQRFEDVANNNFQQSTSESFLRAIGIGESLNVSAKEAAKGIARDFVQTLATQSPANQRQFFDSFEQNLLKGDDQVFEKMLKDPKNAEIFKEAGITNAQQFIDYYYKAIEQNQAAFGNPEAKTLPVPKVANSDLEAMKRYANAEAEIIQAVAKEAGVNEETAKTIKTLTELRFALGVPTRTAAEAEEAYQETLRETARAGGVMSEEQKKALLNSLRLSAGLDEAKSSTEGFGSAATKAATDTNALVQALTDAGLEADALQNVFKQASSDTMDVLYSAANDAFDNMMTGRLDRVRAAGENALNAIEKRQEAAEARFEKRQDAMERKWTVKQRKFDDQWDAIMKSHDTKWENRINKETAVYDARIQAVQNQIDAEKKAEDVRQAIFEAEKTRLERLANLQNKNIDFNVALRSGNMDEAAKIANDIQATTSQYALDDAAKGSQSASEKRQADLEKKLDSIQKEKDARLDALKKMEQAEKDMLDRRKELQKRALEDQKAAEQRQLEASKKALDRKFQQEKEAQQKRNEAAQKSAQREIEIERQKFQLELKALQAFIPRDDAERKKHIAAVEALYVKYGGKFGTYGKQWADLVGLALKSNMKAAGNSLKSDINWKDIGASAAADAISGAFGMSVAEFAKWVTTGEMPKDGLGGRSVPKKVSGAIKKNAPKGSTSYHTGGIVGLTGGGRTGVPSFAPKRPSEIDTRLLVGESVLNRNATKALGHAGVAALNNGQMDAIGGGSDLGMAGIVGAGIAAMMRSVISQAVMTAGSRVMDAGSMFSGVVTGVKLGGEQLKNAASIISAAKSFGASPRDIIIALMTALQESSLRNLNYGDRDSIGLFQQRNAWGSREDRLNPFTATKMFFYGGRAGQRGLFDFKNRDKMSLAQAAQAVQVSAFPGAYAKWESLARALFGGYSTTGINMNAAGGSGYGKPLRNYRVSSEYGYRIHPITGARKLHNGIDLAAPTGTPIFASAGGGVASAGPAGGYGNWTVLNHPGGVQTAYAHQSRIGVRPGQSISKGQQIGYVGSTGMSTGPHLHFMVGRGGTWMNPRSLVPGLSEGGFTINTGLARLHPDEAVLTKPLTQDLKEGIKNIDSSSSNTYHFTIDARGSVMSANEFKKATKEAIMEIEKERGIKRTVGGRN